MKNILLLIFLILAQIGIAYADELPEGLFVINPSSSVQVGSDVDRNLSGYIEVRQNFTDSKIIIRSEKGVFESHSITGDPKDFQVTGLMSDGGTDKTVSLKGRYFGTFGAGDGAQRILFKLSAPDCVAPIFASRPDSSTANLFRNIQEIVH